VHTGSFGVVKIRINAAKAIKNPKPTNEHIKINFLLFCCSMRKAPLFVILYYTKTNPASLSRVCQYVKLIIGHVHYQQPYQHQ
jgi:hypothetical protein